MSLPSMPCQQRTRAVKKADCVVGKTSCEAREESAVSHVTAVLAALHACVCVCAHICECYGHIPAPEHWGKFGSGRSVLQDSLLVQG